MDPKPHGISLGGPSKISGIQIDDLKSEEADARESRPHSRGDTPERPLRGSSSERAPAEPADLDKHDPRERGILVSLHDTILENFPVLLRKLAKGARESPKSASLKDRSTEVYTEPIRSNISDPTTASQYASLQGAFIRFSVWGKEFDVTSGALDKRLEYSDDLREDIILVLLQLCDALYQGLPLLSKNGFVIDQTEQQSTVRILEIAQFYVGDNTYLGVDDTSFATIVDEISAATEGLGDLSFCLETPVEFSAMNEAPRSPHEIGTADSHRVYEEMISHRFPKADPIAICQHAAANYRRLIILQGWRNEADTVPRTIFHDSGIGTTRRHESSYAKSLMSFTRRSNEQYAKLLPKLPQEGASGEQFGCFICLRKVQFANEGLWNAHVLEDLLPYVCIVHDCQRSTEPFKTRPLWLHHLMAKHELNLTKPDLACNLCAEIVTGDQKARVAHVENHLIQISLSVLPTSGDHYTDELDETDAVPRPNLFTPEQGRGRKSSESGVASLDRWFARNSRAGSETTHYDGLKKSDVPVRGREISLSAWSRIQKESTSEMFVPNSAAFTSSILDTGLTPKARSVNSEFSNDIHDKYPRAPEHLPKDPKRKTRVPRPRTGEVVDWPESQTPQAVLAESSTPRKARRGSLYDEDLATQRRNAKKYAVEVREPALSDLRDHRSSGYYR